MKINNIRLYNPLINFGAKNKKTKKRQNFSVENNQSQFTSSQTTQINQGNNIRFQRDSSGKKLFSKKTKKTIMSMDETLQNYAIQLVQIKNKKERIFKNESLLLKLLNKGQEACQCAILLTQAENERKQKLFTDEQSIVSIASSGKKAVELAISLAKKKDEQGNVLIYNEKIIDIIVHIDPKNQDSAVELISQKNAKNRPIFTNVNLIRRILKSKKENIDKTIRIANIKDENGEKLFTQEYIIFDMLGLNDEQLDIATKTRKIKNKNNERIFDEIIAKGIAMQGKETYENIIYFMQNADDEAINLLSNTIASVASKGKEACDCAIRLAKAKDKQGKNLFTSDYAIGHIAKAGIEATNNAIYLASALDENGERLFKEETEIESITKRGFEMCEFAIKLAKEKDEEGKPKYKNKIRDFIELYTNDKDDTQTNIRNIKNALELSTLKDKDGKQLLSEYLISRLIKNCKYFDFREIRLLYEQNANLIDRINKTNLSAEAKNEIITRILKINIESDKNLSLKEKLKLIEIYKEIIECNSLNKNIKTKLKIKEALEKTKKSIQKAITPTKASSKDTRKMFQGFFANNNPKLEELIANTDFRIYKKQGLPLKYSRKAFIFELDNILSQMDPKDKYNLLEKMEITEINNRNQLIGYEGIINLDFEAENEFEMQAQNLAKKFILENEIITDADELNEALNSLIKGMGEFINIIGKTQHNTHDYSIDIHILTTLSELLKNPNYQQLSDIEKTCAKMATIMHDIGKPQGINDKTHPIISALYAKDILSKYKLPYEIKDRIYELIKYHHWLEDLNTNKKDISEISAGFRRKNDIEIARIITEADLKSIDDEKRFYEYFKNVLNGEFQIALNNEISQINSTGQIFLTSKIINKNLIPKTIINGKEYKIINFTELDDDFDLSQYGFTKGTTPENLRLFIHAVGFSEIDNLKTVHDLSNPNYEGFLCASYISLKDKTTFGNYLYGASLESENINIASAYSRNQSSGLTKDFNDFNNHITGKKGQRELIPNSIKEDLNLSDEEYKILYSKIQHIKHLSQLDYMDLIDINERKISAKAVKEAIIKACEKTIEQHEGSHNEVNIYYPKVNALIVKTKYVEKIPQKMLDMAEEYNLPIYLIG